MKSKILVIRLCLFKDDWNLNKSQMYFVYQHHWFCPERWLLKSRIIIKRKAWDGLGIPTLYALVSLINSWTARGLSGFLSGCFSSDNFLYCFLISFNVASDGTSRMVNGSKDWRASMDMTISKFLYQITQKNRATKHLK